MGWTLFFKFDAQEINFFSPFAPLIKIQGVEFTFLGLLINCIQIS